MSDEIWDVVDIIEKIVAQILGSNLKCLEEDHTFGYFNCKEKFQFGEYEECSRNCHSKNNWKADKMNLLKPPDQILCSNLKKILTSPVEENEQKMKLISGRHNFYISRPQKKSP